MASKTKPFTVTFAQELEAKYGKLMTRQDAATELAFSVRTINRMIADGRLHAYQIGRLRSLRLRTADVAALVEQVA